MARKFSVAPFRSSLLPTNRFGDGRCQLSRVCRTNSVSPSTSGSLGSTIKALICAARITCDIQGSMNSDDIGGVSTNDERTDPAKVPEFVYQGGISEFIKHLNRGKSVLHEKPIHFEADREMPEKGTITMEVALQYNDGYSENVFSFANNINTVD